MPHSRLLWSPLALALALSACSAGRSIGNMETATLLVQREYQNFHADVAYSVSFLLVVASVLCLVVVAILRPSEGSHPDTVKEKKGVSRSATGTSGSETSSRSTTSPSRCRPGS